MNSRAAHACARETLQTESKSAQATHFKGVCDNHDLKSKNPPITHRECVTQTQYLVLTCCCCRSRWWSICCLRCCFWVRSLSESNIHKMSMIDHCILPSYSVTLCTRWNSKHFAFKTLKYGKECREVNWHLLGLFVRSVSVRNSHQATRQQRRRFS